MLPQGILSDVPSLDLYRDHWACVVSAEPGSPASLDVAELATRPWVLPYHPRKPALSAWWHPMHERDPAHRWLRQAAVRAAERVDAAG